MIQVGVGDLPDDLKQQLEKHAADTVISDATIELDPEIPEGMTEDALDTELPLLPMNSRAKPVDDDFTGYKIQILHSTEVLDSDHQLFDQHQILNVEARSIGFSYLLGSFPTHDAAQLYLTNSLGDQHPDALIVEFQNGSRVQRP